jgi:hypothetical protein
LGMFEYTCSSDCLGPIGPLGEKYSGGSDIYRNGGGGLGRETPGLAGLPTCLYACVRISPSQV